MLKSFTFEYIKFTRFIRSCRDRRCGSFFIREEIPQKNIFPCDKNGTLSHFPLGNAMILTTAESYYTAYKGG